MDQAIHKCVTEPIIVDAVLPRTMDAPFFSVPMARFITQDIEKVPVERNKMVERLVTLPEEFDEQNNKETHGIPTKSRDSVWSSSPTDG